MSAASLPALRWHRANDLLRSGRDGENDLLSNEAMRAFSPHARRAIEDDIREAGLVAELAQSSQTRAMPPTAQVVMQAEELRRNEFIRLVLDLMTRRELAYVQTDVESLDWSFFEDQTPDAVEQYLTELSFATGLVSWVTSDGRTEYRYVRLRE